MARPTWRGGVKRPARTLPLALVLGTLLVTLLYVCLNAVFLTSAPAAELSGKVEVGHVAAIHLFGEAVGRLLSELITLALISSVSAMVMVGPRVYEAMGEDYRPLRFLRARAEHGGPAAAIALQAGLAIAMLLTAGFGTLLTYIGFTLSLSAALTVGGVFIHRARAPRESARAWGYPVTPALFIAFSGWMVVHALVQRPIEALFGGLTIPSGLLVYLVVRHFSLVKEQSNEAR